MISSTLLVVLAALVLVLDVKAKNLNDSTQSVIERAVRVFNTIESSNNFLEGIDPKVPVTLPVGMVEEVAGVQYDIGIHAIRLKPNQSEFDGFIRFEPKQGVMILVEVTNIKFKNLDGIICDATMELIGERTVSFNDGRILTFVVCVARGPR